ncbi:translation initiation factor IF-2-like [Phyllostomus hastatus]|uniref:translation initiation factor IF-2-like n=1 Tax=Phyllostomus hastatus TaxID=9423 RepID=UPI001E68457F|nr:translation initiation factor IF-2-like [Phyllostomus hastatus]
MECEPERNSLPSRRVSQVGKVPLSEQQTPPQTAPALQGTRHFSPPRTGRVFRRGLPSRRPPWVLVLTHPPRLAHRSAGPDRGAADSPPAPIRLGRCGRSFPGPEQPCSRPGVDPSDLLGAVRALPLLPNPRPARREPPEFHSSGCGSLFVLTGGQVETTRPGRHGRACCTRSLPPWGPRLGAPCPRPSPHSAGQGGRGSDAETPEPPGPRGKRRGPEVGSPRGRGRRIRVSARRPRLPRAAARAAASAADCAERCEDHARESARAALRPGRPPRGGPERAAATAACGAARSSAPSPRGPAWRRGRERRRRGPLRARPPARPPARGAAGSGRGGGAADGGPRRVPALRPAGPRCDRPGGPWSSRRRCRRRAARTEVLLEVVHKSSLISTRTALQGMTEKNAGSIFKTQEMKAPAPAQRTH